MKRNSYIRRMLAFLMVVMLLGNGAVFSLNAQESVSTQEEIQNNTNNSLDSISLFNDSELLENLSNFSTEEDSSSSDSETDASLQLSVNTSLEITPIEDSVNTYLVSVMWTTNIPGGGYFSSCIGHRCRNV